MSDETEIKNSSSIKLPKDCASNRYYYRHRDAILEKKKLNKQSDTEYVKRKLEREQKRIEKERITAEREETRRLKKQSLLDKLK